MSINRKTVVIAAVAAALAAGGVGIANAVGGGDDSEEQVAGPNADKASSAALDAVGGGTVTEVEFQESGSAGFYEVEVQRDDGSQVEVLLDDQFQQVDTVADDDSEAEEDEGAEHEGAADDD